MKTQANLQFAPGADLRGAEAAVRATPGVKKLTQVFPNHEDDELERMYIVELEPAQQLAAIAELRAFPAVESLEIAPTRGIRPKQVAGTPFRTHE